MAKQNDNQQTKSKKEIELEQEKNETQLQKDIAEAELAIALANQKRLIAQLPTGQTKPLEGKITTDASFGYLAEISAYRAMSEQADKIAEDVVKGLDENAKIFVVDSLDICAADVLLLQIKGQIDSWQRELESQVNQINRLVPQPRTGELEFAVTAGSAILSSLADIVGYFQVDYAITGQKFELGNAALQALVAGKIRNKRNSLGVLMQDFHRIKSSPLVADFNTCTELRGKLAAALAVLTEKLETDLKGDKDAKTIAGQSKSILRSFDEFNKSATSVPQNGTLSPLARATIRNYLDDFGITHVLYVTVSSAGGESITKRWLWARPEISFLGAGAYTYVLAQCDGTIVAADTIVGAAHAYYKLGQANRLSFGHQR